MGKACDVYGRGAYRVLVGNLREEDCLEDVGRNGRIILYEILRKLDLFEDSHLLGCNIV
jgi:hypothetical protein